MTGDAWWSAVPPVEASVPCGGGTHRLRWAHGTLEALDHADTEGEGLLVALGATRPECLEVLASWHAHRDDLRILTLGPRHDRDRPVISRAAVDGVRTGQFASHLQSTRAARAQMPPPMRASSYPPFASLDEQEDHLRSHLELLGLFTLPVALQQRLCATVAAEWCRRDPHASALYAALVGRARPALRAWAGGRVAVELTIGPSARVERTDTGAVKAELPPTWLVDVWGPGLALVDGHFGLEMVDDHRLRAVAPDGTVLTRPLTG